MVSRPFQGKKVGVLMGGWSSEREVSLMSGEAVCQALRERGYGVVPLFVEPDGAWITKLQWVEVVFIALHGKWGEDGSLQGLLEILRIPYTGSGILACALSMNKIMAKRVWLSQGLPTAPWQTFRRGTPETLSLSCPVVVKPNNEGSSVGVSLVHSPQELPSALSRAFRYDPEALVETYIPGREVTVGILGKRVLGAMEVVAQGASFPTYEAKYTPGRETFLLPAPLPPSTYKRVLEVGLEAYRALGCEGYGRVDTRVTEEGEVFLLEVNTLPGLTPLSYLPRLAQHAGLSYGDLVEEILNQAALKIPRGEG